MRRRRISKAEAINRLGELYNDINYYQKAEQRAYDRGDCDYAHWCADKAYDKALLIINYKLAAGFSVEPPRNELPPLIV